MNYHSDIIRARKRKKCMGMIELNPEITSIHVFAYFLMVFNTYLSVAILIPFSTKLYQDKKDGSDEEASKDIGLMLFY